MYFYFALFTILSFGVSYHIYGRKMNPITLYGGIWLTAISLYKSNLIIFNSVSNYTIWIVLIVYIVFFGGCLTGVLFSKIRILNLKSRDHIEKKILLEKTIFFMTLLASIDIIYKFIITIFHNGINIYSNISKLYFSELYSGGGSQISLSSLLFISITFSGIYITLYGINKKIIFPILVSIIQQLSMGSRGVLVSLILLFLSSFFVHNRINEIWNKKIKKKLSFLVFFMVSVLGFVTAARIQRTGEIYAGCFLKKIPIFSGVIAKGIEYISSGIGCLDQFLMDPVRNQNAKLFFRVPFIFLNKLGITSVNTNYHGITYYIPFPSNVITYIGELYYDFGLLFLIPIFVMSAIFSIFFCKSIKSNNIVNKVLFSPFFVIFSLSFFVYFGRLANIWYVLTIGTLIALYIEYQL